MAGFFLGYCSAPGGENEWEPSFLELSLGLLIFSAHLSAERADTFRSSSQARTLRGHRRSLRHVSLSGGHQHLSVHR